MKKHISRKQQSATAGMYPEGCTVGLDVSDEFTYAAVIDQAGQLLAEDRIRTREPELRRWLSSGPPALVALETGTHSRWMAKLARQCGHNVLVANARELRLIYSATNKTDRVDAVKLARLARLDPELLKPIQHRGDREHADLAVIGARELLVKMRAEAINMVRGMVKADGGRVAACASGSFTRWAAEVLPDPLRNALAPILEQIDEFSERIRDYDERIEHLARTRYPQVFLLTQIAGVGTLTALTFVLTIGDPWRFERSRDVGCYVGLQPRRNQSGEQDPQLRITKTGDSRLRRMLVNCAHFILGPFGPDTDLRRWGLQLAGQTSKGKKRAIVAVARKLAVLLHRLLTTGEVYQPLRNAGRQVAASAA
jgi:transposase